MFSTKEIRYFHGLATRYKRTENERSNQAYVPIEMMYRDPDDTISVPKVETVKERARPKTIKDCVMDTIEKRVNPNIIRRRVYCAAPV